MRRIGVLRALRRAIRLCSLARGVPGRAREAGVDGRRQSPDRTSLGPGNPDRMKTFAKELVDLRPDAIFSVTTPVIGALVRETQTIPIVIATVADPVSSGFVTSLGRPGGNVTGFALYEPGNGREMAGTAQANRAGDVTRVALLFHPATTVPVKFYMSSIEAAASSFAIQASTAPVHAKDEIDGVIAALAGNPGGGLIVMPDLFNDEIGT